MRFLTRVQLRGSARGFNTKVHHAGSTRRFITVVLGAALVPAALVAQQPLGLGRPATPDEIRALDIDVRPDGLGLPAGSGTVATGRDVYAAKCASCHGAAGEGGSADRLVGRESGTDWNFATDPKLVKTVGNYWPYATTLFDYTRRAMPFNRPGTLTADETYALVAFVLRLNEIVDDAAVMNRETLPKVAMPARNRFVPDNRRGKD